MSCYNCIGWNINCPYCGDNKGRHVDHASNTMGFGLQAVMVLLPVLLIVGSVVSGCTPPGSHHIVERINICENAKEIWIDEEHDACFVDFSHSDFSFTLIPCEKVRHCK